MTNSGNTRRPGMMLIMRSVAEILGITTEAIIARGRCADLVLARSAVYHIAVRRGYSREEIMYFLDRDRTSSYTYETNIANYLAADPGFVGICEGAERLLQAVPHREPGLLSEQPQEKNRSPEDRGQPLKKRSRKRGILIDWEFSEEESEEARKACQEAEEFMEKFCRVPTVMIPPAWKRNPCLIEQTPKEPGAETIPHLRQTR